ncbi:putative protein FAR1-RELATED SEQUENCE 10 [Triticum aestivum]|uniref:putative protein FAR1-RELATED SEQUENCE 10 n=1 Tax=Triticum aestivum TaxID=4565 RepID=UPI001D009A23|nr:putative protein FAR1-RELATED SEQUENCE 10 [Triticum aestivum]
MRAPPICSSGSSRASHRVDASMTNDVEDGARSQLEATVGDDKDLSINNLSREHADSLEAGSCEVRVEDAGGGEATSTWKRRVRLSNGDVEREWSAERKSALEVTIRRFAEKKEGVVINPKIGLSFDSLNEAYEFYNLYSREIRFGIRFARSRLNVKRAKCMQELVCGCAGTPIKENDRSSRCGCEAKIRLLRSFDNGWYISEHHIDHNHPMSTTCGQKLHWKSHKYINTHTKDLVKQLSENNCT